MTDSTPKKKLKVRLELDPDSGQWVASVQLPKRLLDAGLSQASGSDAGQARNRLVSQIEQQLPDAYEFEVDFIPPPELADRVAEFQANALEAERLNNWLREKRVPLALALAHHRVPQNFQADLLRCTPTWLGHELKKHGTAPTGNTGKVFAGSAGKTGTSKLQTGKTGKINLVTDKR